MRIWSLHPQYLDQPGLTACWRETLLAQAVLAGRTRGYRSHPQLDRFGATFDPIGSICWYLHGIADEADARGYRFDRRRIDRIPIPVPVIEVNSGQLDYEWSWLRRKLTARSPTWLERWNDVVQPESHRSFAIADGPIARWERASSA
jgi:hypothetical protein